MRPSNIYPMCVHSEAPDSVFWELELVEEI